FICVNSDLFVELTSTATPQGVVGVTLTYQEQIEAMQRLLEAPKANMTTFTDQSFKQDIATDPRSELATNYDELTTPQQDNKRIPIPEHVEPEQKKRGFLSRFFLPYG
ncbi:hypothetical protein ACQY8R_003936, partial [Acinetobacter baumannii]